MVSKGLTGVARAVIRGDAKHRTRNLAPHPTVVPAKAGIQYAAASSAHIAGVSGILDRPVQAGRRQPSDIPAARFARALQTVSPKQEGAGNAGCLLHPRSRVQEMVVDAHTSIQVQSEHSGIPCAMVLRLMPRSPRRRIPLASVIGELTASREPGRARNSLRRLDASHGRQDHTVLPYASVPLVCRAADRSQAKARPAISSAQRALPRPPHSEPNVRDDRDTPLLAGRNGRDCRADLGEERRGLFLSGKAGRGKSR